MIGLVFTCLCAIPDECTLRHSLVSPRLMESTTAMTAHSDDGDDNDDLSVFVACIHFSATLFRDALCVASSQAFVGASHPRMRCRWQTAATNQTQRHKKLWSNDKPSSGSSSGSPTEGSTRATADPWPCHRRSKRASKRTLSKLT